MLTEEETDKVAQEVTKEVIEEVTQRITEKVNEEVNEEVTEEVAKEVAEKLTEELLKITQGRVKQKTEESVTFSALGGGWVVGAAVTGHTPQVIFLLLKNPLYVLRKPQNKLCVHS